MTLLMAHRVFLTSEPCASGHVPLPANTTIANTTTEPPHTRPNLLFSLLCVCVCGTHFIGLWIISCTHLDRMLEMIPLYWLKDKTFIWQVTAQERHPLQFFPNARCPLKMCSAHSKDSLFSQITGFLRRVSPYTTARHFNVACACCHVVVGM